MLNLKNLLDPLHLFKCLEDGFGTSRRFPEDLQGAVPLPTEGLDSLPDEILFQIVAAFGSGSQVHLNRLSKTCRRLYQIVQPSLFTDLIIGRSNLNLVHPTLRAKPKRKTYIQGFTFELDEIQESYPSSFGSFGEQKAIAKLFADLFADCENLEWIELRRRHDAESWRSSGYWTFLKDCLKSLAELPKLTTLICTEGRFPLNNFPCLPNIQFAHFSERSSEDYATHWQYFPNLRTLRMRSLDSHQAISLFYCLKAEAVQLQDITVNVQGERIVNLKLHTATDISEGSRHLTFDLRPMSLLEPNGDMLESFVQTRNTIVGIILAYQVEKATLLYSIPDEWLGYCRVIPPDCWDTALASGLPEVHELEIGIKKIFEGLSENLANLHVLMELLASHLRDETQVSSVELSFVDADMELMGENVRVLIKEIIRDVDGARNDL